MHRMRWNVLAVSISAVALAPLIASAAWIGPTASPPNGNVAAPVNVGTTAQVKNGGLGVNSLAVFGNAILNGVGRYFNFGSTAGTNGYGIRDNAGLLEFKNSGGSWESIQTTVFNLVGGTGSWTASGNNIYNNNSGDVGIGTASPGAKLAVLETSAGGLADQLLLTNSSGIAGSEAGLFFAPTTAGGVIRGARISGIQENGSNAIGLKFYTGAGASITEKMRISSAGNVGIGTNSPTQKLDVAGAIIAPLMYDRDNAGYYVDPNGTSRMGNVNPDSIYDYGSVNASSYYDRSIGLWMSQLRLSQQLGPVYLSDSSLICNSGNGVVIGMSTPNFPNGGILMYCRNIYY